MQRNKILIAAIGGIFLTIVVSGVIWGRLVRNDASISAGNSGRLVGALSSSPFDSRLSASGAESNASPPKSLRSRYFSAKDKFALYQELRVDARAEAQYLAYRIVKDCKFAISDAADSNDLQYMFKKALAENSDGNRGLDEQRRKAFDDLTGPCAGFTRPNVFPALYEQERLRESADKQGFGPAIAARLPTEPTKIKDAWNSSVAAAMDSRDPMAFDEAKLSLMALRQTQQIAGVSNTQENSGILIVAIEIAGCDLLANCGANNSRVLMACAYGGNCAAQSVQDLLTNALPENQRQQAIELGNVIASRFLDGTLLTRQVNGSTRA